MDYLIASLIEFVLLGVVTYLWFRAGADNGRLLHELRKSKQHNEHLEKELADARGHLLDDWNAYRETHHRLLNHWTVRFTAWLR